MRYVLIAALTVLFIVCGRPDFLLDPEVPNFCKACSYGLFHANVFHLAVNCLSLWAIFSVTSWRSDRQNCRNFLTAFLISVLTWYTATKPIVGISNVLYAAIGLRTPALNNPWWKRPETITFLVVTLLMLLIPRLSSVTHITSFIAGMAVAGIKRKINA